MYIVTGGGYGGSMEFDGILERMFGQLALRRRRLSRSWSSVFPRPVSREFCDSRRVLPARERIAEDSVFAIPLRLRRAAKLAASFVMDHGQGGDRLVSLGGEAGQPKTALRFNKGGQGPSCPCNFVRRDQGQFNFAAG